jgi:hypothetical protein
MKKILGNEVNMEVVQSALLRNFEKVFPMGIQIIVIEKI